LIKINISNTKKYKLHGFDIYTDLFLTPWEAALGTKANVETIDDSTSIFVPNGIESGEKIRIPKKGYKDGKGGRGDLVAEVKIMVPKELSEEETNIYKKLKEISNFEPRNNINQM
jgi:curved DNA-binding protein